MRSNRFSRRQLLSGVAGAGGVSIAGFRLMTRGSQQFTDSTRIQLGTSGDVLLEWREIYNGATVTTPTAPSTSATPGFMDSLGNVLPGDSGSLTIRIRRDPVGDDSETALALTMAMELVGELQSPGLQDFIHTSVWYDTGLLGLASFGGRNGARDVGEPLVHPDAQGSLNEVATVLADGISLDPAPHIPRSDCFMTDDAVTITFGWSFPPEQRNVNVVQGDSVAFDFRFDAAPC